MKRALISAVLVAAGALALTGVGTVSAAGENGAGTGDRVTMNLIGHETAVAQLDLGTPGPSLGDEVVFSGQLLNPDGDQVGHFEGTLTAVTPEANSQSLAVVVLGLRGGQITVQGELNFATQTDFVHAITGGTGAYRDAGGEFSFRDTAQRGVIDITLQIDRRRPG